MDSNATRLKRSLAYFRPHLSSIIISILCTIVIGGVAGATAWLVQPVLDDIFIKGDQEMLKLVPVVLISLYFVKGICTFGQGYMMNRVCETVIMDMRRDLVEHIQSRELAFFDRTPTGTLVNKVLADVAVVQNAIPIIIMQVRQYISASGLIIVLFTRDWVLASIALVVLPTIALPLRKIGKKIKKYSTKSALGSDVLARLLLESFMGVEVVKAFNWQKAQAKRFREGSMSLLEIILKRGVMNNITSPTVEFMGAVGAAVIVWYGGHQVMAGKTTAGNFFSFLAAFFMVYDPLKRIGTTSNQLQQARVSAERVFEMFDEPIDRCETEGTLPLSPEIGEIEYRDVKFTYPSRPDQTVLKGVSFKAERGQIIALVGDSGGGKSTVLKLLPRYYTLDSGQILINGTAITEYTADSLRSRMAIVNQSPFLFDETIYQNILMGRPDATDEEVKAAAKAAYAHKFIEGLPQGYETKAGQRGDLLSGGQKQRVAIARAILRGSPILILDEATSALDSEAEKEIQLALSDLMKGRTTFVIAHRLSTIVHADKILFIKDGRVVEEGTHQQLIAANGDYAKLCRIQFGGE